MRWAPRTLSGQLVALWLLAMVAAHVIAVLVLSWWRAENVTIHPLAVRSVESRVLSAYRLAARSPDAPALLEDLSLPDSAFRLADQALPLKPDAMGSVEHGIAQRLRGMLNLSAQSPVQVQLQQDDARPRAGHATNWLETALGGASAWALDIDIQLPDGRWLQSRHWPTTLPAHWSRVLSFSLLVGMLPTAIIALLFGRRIMRPLKLLTAASQRVSRGEQVILPPPDRLSGVREITQAFNDMQENLVRFVNGRTQMLAAIGHDLRTPLTSLRIRAELIDDEALRNAMVRTIDDMSVMVEETLRFVRDDALREPTQEVNVAALVQEIVDQQTIQGRSIACTLQIDPAMSYRCRPVHLKRGLNNLLDNAARYGEVRLGVLADKARRVLRIEVQDHGPGIDPAQLQRVFEPFTRLDASRSAHTGGLGLGLAIARSCIRAHGGDIALHNCAEGGLRAVVELPN
jgi:signal transduction histidine kinase